MKKIERELVPIHNIPINYFDSDLFSGELEEVAKRILNIKVELKNKIAELEKDKYFTVTPFSDYAKISLSTDWDHEYGIEVKVLAWRWETDEELVKKHKEQKNRRIAALAAATKRKNKQEKNERELYEKLKLKFK